MVPKSVSSAMLCSSITATEKPLRQKSMIRQNRRIIAATSFVIIAVMMAMMILLTAPNFLTKTKGSFGVAAHSVTLPNYYMNGMVFQRGKAISVHGTTDRNAELSVSLRGKDNESSVTVRADSKGNFTAKLPALPASLSPCSFTVSGNGETLFKLDKTYVGDVFVAAGQSNMDDNYVDYYGTDAKISANMGDAFDSDDLPTTISDDHVHFLVAGHTGTDEAVKKTEGLPLRSFSSKSWVSATQANSPRLSYLAQFFAERLRKKSPDVPVGIIQIAWGGTSLKRHMPGGDIYRSHVLPLKGFTVGGILWYQGENDAENISDATSYASNFVVLINRYRDIFGDASLPFLYVQLARYEDGADTSVVRQGQSDALRAVADTSNIGMSVAIDTDKGTSKVIHPLGKDILAERMAAQWEAMRAGKSVPQSPIAVHAVRSKFNASIVAVKFLNHTGKGLQAMIPRYSTSATPSRVADPTDDDLQGFEVAGEDGVFKPALALINDDTVVVHSEDVESIYQVRYLWDTDPSSEVLLYNGSELPASPFTIGVDQLPNES